MPAPAFASVFGYGDCVLLGGLVTSLALLKLVKKPYCGS